MKICFLANNYTAIGGLERVLSIVANSLSKHIDVNLISLYNTSNNNPYYYNSHISCTTLFQGNKKYYIKQFRSAIQKINKIVTENKFDFLIYVGELMTPYAYLSCKNTNTKCICWTHTNAYVYDNPIVQQILRNFSMKKAYYTITLTKENKEILSKKYHTNKITYIYNPIDPIINNTKEYDVYSKKILSVGRISYPKNYEELIEVANLVFKKIDGWTWDIYGAGNKKDSKKLADKINKFGLSDKVFLKGNTNNIYELYQNYSMLVLTSRYECLPMVLIEGLSFNLPLVSYDIKTGPNEIISNNINGYLAQQHNIVDISNKIIDLINNPKIRKDFSNNCNNTKKQFNIDYITNQWINLLKNI